MNTKTPKIRLDCLLVERGLAGSRQRAQALILPGTVLVGDRPADKAGMLVPADAEIRIQGEENPYVSRGGLKLRGALDAFGLSVQGLDSPGRGGLHRRLHRLPPPGGGGEGLCRRCGLRPARLEAPGRSRGWSCIERTNIRHYDGGGIADGIDIAVIDASFISLRLVIPPVLRLIRDGAILVALVKPQFEVGRGEVGKRGVVRDPALHERVLAEIEHPSAGTSGSMSWGAATSPLTGPAGNREFFICLKKPPKGGTAGDTGEK